MMLRRSLLYVIGTYLSSLAYAGVPISTGIYGSVFVTGSQAANLSYQTVWPTNIVPGYSGTASTTLLNSQAVYKFGGGGGALIGYRSTCFRLELEYLYNENQVSTLTSGAANARKSAFSGQTYVNGHLIENMGFVNAYYDLKLGPAREGYLDPYIGVGVGQGRIHTSTEFYLPTTQTIPTTYTHVENNRNAFQGIAGITYTMDSEASLFLDYRYIAFAHGNNNINNMGDIKVSTINLGITFLLLDTTAT